jgi:hypothetical protein
MVISFSSKTDLCPVIPFYQQFIVTAQIKTRIPKIQNRFNKLTHLRIYDNTLFI